ncbi:ABC transporter ATP-binding protein [Candidatus Hydrogenedentota bacterium]
MSLDSPTATTTCEGGRGQWRTFLNILWFVRPYWHFLLLQILLKMVFTLLFVVNPFFIVWMYDEVIPNHDIHLFTVLMLAVAVWICVFMTQNLLVHIIGNYFSLRVKFNIKVTFLKHMEHLSMAFFHERPVGENMFRCWDDIEEACKMLGIQLPTIIEQSFSFVMATVLTLILDWRVALVILGYAVIYAPIAHLVANLMRKYERAWRVRGQELKAVLQEGLHGYATIKASGKRTTEIRRYMRATSRWYRQWLKYWVVRDIILWQLVSGEAEGGEQADITGMEMVANPFLPWLRNLSIMTYIFFLVIFGKTTLGAGMALVEFINRPELANPIRRMIDHIQRLRVRLVSAERMFETFRRLPSVSDKKDAKRLPPIEKTIEFKDVHFAYEEREILKGLSFTMEKNKPIAFVGESGIGKSTIVNLALRLYDPQAGAVLVDGVDVCDVKQDSLRKQFGLVLQDTFLFGGTLAENIRYGKPTASDEEVIQAAKAVDIHDLITAMPDGYDTEVSEGMGMSVGQKQRIAIARAIIRDPRVLILDEATSSLDAETEKEFIEVIERIKKDRMVLIISHRISTAMSAEIIYSMEDGRIAEGGTHDELVAKDGIYAQMYKFQFSTELGKNED